jgi:hypothetical protein
MKKLYEGDDVALVAMAGYKTCTFEQAKYYIVYGRPFGLNSFKNYMGVIWICTAFQKTNFYGHSVIVVRYFQERIQKVDFCSFFPAKSFAD